MDYNLPLRRKSSFATRFTRLSGLALLSSLLSVAGLRAQSTHVLTQPVPLPPSIEAPNDKPYPGIIQLHVDATDVLRRIYQIHETIPVTRPGTHTFLFPEWTPGDHAPDEPLEKLAGLVFTANGNRLRWVRDMVTCTPSV